MNPSLKAVIFDFDGVIADTVHLYYEATKRVADELEVSYTMEDNLRFQGIPRKILMDELANRCAREVTEEEKLLLGNKKGEYYRELITGFTNDDMLPGMYEFLFSLKESGIKMGIASSSSNAPFLLEKFGIKDWFGCIVDPHKLKKGKPDPEIFLTAADCLGIPYDCCAAVEDGEAGLQGIMATPMFSVSIGRSVELKQAEWNVPSTDHLTLDELLRRFANR
ncbi:beta-phosphoglucomutase [Niallia sp. BSM11]|uniref:beta-phosphoglucomutase n=1 Tax=Niallia sp. BSM11 TaxID=3391576 RepID=UPI0039853D98